MKHGVQKSQAWASTEKWGWLLCLLNSSKVQVFKSSKVQKFATWGERPASLCGGNTSSSQELQTPCQHDQLLLDNVNNSHPQHFSLRSDQRLEGSDAQVGGTTCWSSSSVMLVVFSRASTSSKLWHWRIWKTGIFNSELWTKAWKKTLSLLCCHQCKNHHCRYYDIVNFILISMVGSILINWKVLQSTSCLVASLAWFLLQISPRYTKMCPKYTKISPK